MQPEFHSGAVTRPLSAILQLAMMGCPALRARGELAAGACAPVLGWDRGGSSSAGARAWWYDAARSDFYSEEHPPGISGVLACHTC